MSRRTRYEGTYALEGRFMSKFMGEWSPWAICATRGTEKAARREAKSLCREKTTIEQEFRLLHPDGTIMEEYTNAKNVLRG